MKKLNFESRPYRDAQQQQEFGMCIYHLLDDPESIRFNNFIRNKFNRGLQGDTNGMDQGDLQNNILLNILFSENAKNKIVRYLSLAAFTDPRSVKERSPFLDISETTFSQILREVLSYQFKEVPEELRGKNVNNAILSLYQCKTHAHFVQMLAKAGKQYRAPYIPDSKFTADIKNAIAVGTLNICSSFYDDTASTDLEENSYINVFFGKNSSLVIPNTKEEVTMDFAITLYKYLITKALRFYITYFKMQALYQYMPKAYEEHEQLQVLFGYTSSYDSASISFDFTKISSDNLLQFILDLTSFVLEEKSAISFLIASIEEHLIDKSN